MSILSSLKQKFTTEKKAIDDSYNERVWRTISGYGWNDREFTKEEALKLYRTNIWIHKGTEIICSNLANITVRLKREIDGEEVFLHPVLELLKRPNAIHNGYTFRELTHTYLELTGEAYWVISGRGARLTTDPKEMYLLNPALVTIKRSGNGIGKFIYNNGSKTIELEPEDVISFLYPDPADYLVGLSPIECAANEIVSDQAANVWNRAFFENFAQIGNIFGTDQPMGEENMKRVITAFDQMHKGADKAFKNMILDNGLKPLENSRSQKDMDFVKQNEMYRDKILGAMGISKTILGLSEAVNYATSQAAIYNFCRFTLEPKIHKYVETLNQDLLPEFGMENDYYFEADDIRPQDVSENLARWRLFLDKGVMTPNEVRVEDNLEGDIEGGELPRQPQSQPQMIQETYKNTKSQEDRNIIKRALDSKARRNEKIINDLVRSLFIEQKEKVMAVIKEKKSFNKSLVGDLSELFKAELVRWVDKFTPKLTGIFAKEGQDALDEIGAGEFNVTDPYVKKFISNQSINFSKKVNETTEIQIKEAIAKGIENNATTGDIAAAIDGIFDTATTSRAKMIAETEVTKATNGSRGLAWDTSPDVTGKEWITLLDGNERDDHNAADGQKVGKNQPFEVGGEYLEYPGDPAGSAANVINCRCRMIPIVQ